MRGKRGRGRAQCYRSVKAFRQLTGRAGDWIGQRGKQNSIVFNLQRLGVTGYSQVAIHATFYRDLRVGKGESKSPRTLTSVEAVSQQFKAPIPNMRIL